MLQGSALHRVSEPGLVVEGIQGNGDSFDPCLSPDGRTVLFASSATDLLPAGILPEAGDPPIRLYLRDMSIGFTTLVTVNPEGAPSLGGDSLPLGWTSDGQSILFESEATNLVRGDLNGYKDIFVRNLNTRSNILVSVGLGGDSANGESRDAVITADGRFVAFVSEASNLVSDDTNGIEDVFVRDLTMQTTHCASPGAIRDEALCTSFVGAGSDAPSISHDGRYVAFCSSAIHLLPGVVDHGGIYVRDLMERTTFYCSAEVRSLLGKSAKEVLNCYHPSLSADGSKVAFLVQTNSIGSLLYDYPVYRATNAPKGVAVVQFNLQNRVTLVIDTNAFLPYDDGWGSPELQASQDGRYIIYQGISQLEGNTIISLFLWDSSDQSRKLLATGQWGGDIRGIAWPILDESGHKLAFYSTTAGLLSEGSSPDAPGQHLYMLNLSDGLLRWVDSGISHRVGRFNVPSLSRDGRFAAFTAEVPQGTNMEGHAFSQVYYRDLAEPHCRLVTLRDKSSFLNHAHISSISKGAAANSDGAYVAFASQSDSQLQNIYVRNMTRGTTIWATPGMDGKMGDGYSGCAGLSADGNFLVFASTSSNLALADTNSTWDIFIRDLSAETTRLISERFDGQGAGNAASFSPAWSISGQKVAFFSEATNLTADLQSNSNGFRYGVFLRDVASSQTRALGYTSYYTPGQPLAISPDGRLISWVSRDNSNRTWSLWMSDGTSTRQVVTLARKPLSLVIRPDGRWIAYVNDRSYPNQATNSELGACHSSEADVRVIAWYPRIPEGRMQFSQDGRWLVYDALEGGRHSVFLYDFSSEQNHNISQNFDASDPAISPDGRFIAFCARSTTLLQRKLVIYDRLTEASQIYEPPGNGRSFGPVFSSDGVILAFNSTATSSDWLDWSFQSEVFALNFIKVAIAKLAGSSLEISWPSWQDAQYTVQYKDDVNDSSWTNLKSESLNNRARTSVHDPNPPAGHHYYRVIED